MSVKPSTASGLRVPLLPPAAAAAWPGGREYDLRMERRPTTEPRRFISTRRCSSMLTFLHRGKLGG